MDLDSASLAVKTISSAVRLVDSVYDTWAKFRRSGQVDSSAKRDYGEKITLSTSGDALVHTTGGRVAKKITRQELSEKLSQSELSVLQAIEKRMEILVSKWSSITKSYETLTPSQQGASKIEMDDICNDLSLCLAQVMKMLEYIGFELQDHYGAVKMIAETRT